MLVVAMYGRADDKARGRASTEESGCYGAVPGTAITVFDWSLDRITRLDRDGNVIDTRALAGTGVQPYGSPACSPTGDLVFVGWPGSELDSRPAGVGEIYRWEMAVSWERDDGCGHPGRGDPRNGAPHLWRRVPGR